MTTQLVISARESLPIGLTSAETVSSSPAPVLYREFGPTRPIPLPNTIALSVLVQKYEQDPTKAARLTEARKKMSESLYADEPDTLSALRLAAGLSQAQLAERLQTSQSYVARIEGGRLEPGISIVPRLAAILGIDEVTAYRSLQKQYQTRGREE